MPESVDTIELHFPVTGYELPADHAYSLFSALCKFAPVMHDADWLGIHNINGTKRDTPGMMILDENAKLRLRLPVARIEDVYDIAAKRLVVDGFGIECGAPTIVSITPGTRLRARTVILKPAHLQGNITEAEFLNSVQRQLNSLGVAATVNLEPDGVDSGSARRRVVRVAGATLQGYTVVLSKIELRDSITIQCRGIGGRRKFGCGLFVPI